MHLTQLDLTAAIMDRPQRPVHWAIVLHMEHAPALEMLRRGALSAKLAYPTSSSVLNGRAWRRIESTPGVEVIEVVRGSVRKTIERVVNEPMDIRSVPPIAQYVIDAGGSTLLVTRFHSAAADLIGGASWLLHQLEVAIGARPTQQSKRPYAPLPLRWYEQTKKKNAFSFRSAPDRLAHASGSPSPARRWSTESIPAAPLRTAALNEGTFTYNDLLTTCALETYRTWNAERGTKHQQIGVVVPTNIRKTPLNGFGNASTRLRVYNRYEASASLIEKARMVRTQVHAARRNGECALPSFERADELSLPLLKAVMRMHDARPWADVGTGVFSHAERSPLDALPPELVSRVELMGTLDRRHPFGIYALTLQDTTHLSFVYDPAQIRDDDASSLAHSFLTFADSFRMRSA